MKALIFILFILIQQAAWAQNADKRNQAVRSLNLYVQYCNETIHGFWMLFRSLEDFNGGLLQKDGKKLTAKDYFPAFRNDSIFTHQFYYTDYKIPQLVYEECISKSTALEVQDQQSLNSKLTRLKGLVDKCVINSNSLDNFCKNKLYLTDTTFSIAYKTLDEFESLFKQYDALKDSLFAEIQGIYKNKYPPTNQQKPIVTMGKQMEEAVAIYKNILDDLSKDDTTQFVNRKNQVKPLIDSLEGQMERNIKGLYRFGKSNGLDIGWRYEMVVDGLKALYRHQESFSKVNWEKKSKQLGKYSSALPKTFHYYNTDFTNKYNRYGLGLISKYNAFLELADGKLIQKTSGISDVYIKNGSVKMDVSMNILLYWVEEPHLYRVVRPQREDIPLVTSNPQNVQTSTENTVIDFNKVEVGKAINLKNILFRLSESILLSSSYTELNNLLKFLQENPKVKIQLEGHTDYYGNPKGNMKLSKDRVNVVKSYLVNKGISAKRIQLKWYGGTRPIVHGQTEDDRKANRRVECVILEK